MKLVLFYLALALPLLGILYAPQFPSLWATWKADPNYGHGMLVPLLAAFLVFLKRREISRIEPDPSSLGLLVVLLGVIQYLVGVVANELFTTRSSLIVVILGMLLTLWGKRGARTLLLPVLYLIFMIPLPYIVYNAVAFPMKLFATQWSVFFLDLLRISAYREGNIIHLPNTTLEVANACSGLRSLMSLITFGVVFAYVAQKTKLTRAILIAAILPIAIVANIIRIIVTALLAHYKGPETADGFLHDASGAIVYTVATLMVFGVNEVLRFFLRGRGGTVTG
ncbi:MAG: exosortase/archaeosortase family protein [bacterium]|nr:exosortase/archaeosortase family protein [bacterium]